ncbi:MAG: ABC transporter permease [Clostridiales bacterium]|nr:ABC transporter permease [Clostridiales bacterium]
MKIRTWRLMAGQGFRNVFRNRIMSLASISAIAAALFVLGLVLAMVLNFNNIISGLESKVEITVFLKDNVQSHEIEAMSRQLNDWEGIKEWKFVSRDEALENWREEWGEQKYLLDGYTAENNPLPDSFHITVENPDYVTEMVEKLRKLTKVEVVQYSKDVVDTITRIANATRILGLAVVVILIIMAMIIIHNTIRISVYSRRREINIMKYIGATDWYIRWPFIMEGISLGIMGAVIAGSLTAGIYYLLVQQLAESPMEGNILSLLQLLPLESIIYQIVGLFLLVGSVVGVIASVLSIRKHLRV